uniref:helix-turn-helix domain-containing protein n=1 Tax=Paenibacillus sp. FSL L8-0436 TaxID=2954686 RepID=UPI00406D246C
MGPVPVRCHIPELLARIDKNQQWLAEKTGIRKQRISDYVHLRFENISMKKAVLLAYHLDCLVDDLFDWDMR